MKNNNTTQSGRKAGEKRAPYEVPAIIYVGQITIRGSSNTFSGPDDGGVTDPAKTFSGPGG